MTGEHLAFRHPSSQLEGSGSARLRTSPKLSLDSPPCTLFLRRKWKEPCL